MQRYPLTWPDNWKRTPSHHRTVNASWKLGTDRYRRHLWEQLRILGVDEVLISTNKPLRVDGEFRVDTREPEDPGVAVYFDYKDKPFCFACDRYMRVEWNLHAIGLTVEAIRTIERCGASDMMERAFRGFTALPEKSGEYWRDVFGFAPEQKVTAEDVEREFRRLAHSAHPDKGGNIEVWQQLVVARENARKDLGVAR